MNRTEVDNYFKDLERIEHSKNILPNLKIQWETDIDKMDFSKLRWFPEELLSKPFQIEYISTTNLMHELYPDLFNNRDNEMNNLIDFVNTGAKIIPPSFIRMPKLLLSRQKENGIITEIFTKQGLCIHDGCHRISLAKGVGLTEIPILIFDFDDDCKRSIMNWVAREGYEWEKHRDNTGTIPGLKPTTIKNKITELLEALSSRLKCPLVELEAVRKSHRSEIIKSENGVGALSARTNVLPTDLVQL